MQFIIAICLYLCNFYSIKKLTATPLLLITSSTSFTFLQCPTTAPASPLNGFNSQISIPCNFVTATTAISSRSTIVTVNKQSCGLFHDWRASFGLRMTYFQWHTGEWLFLLLLLLLLCIWATQFEQSWKKKFASWPTRMEGICFGHSFSGPLQWIWIRVWHQCESGLKIVLCCQVGSFASALQLYQASV